MNFLSDLIPNSFLETIPLIGLYAESHFRFKIPFSRYFQREPELIFDTPWRLEPGQTATLFLVIKDAHLYPVTLNSVRITALMDEQVVHVWDWSLDQKIEDYHTSLDFHLSDVELPFGEIDIIPSLNYSIRGKAKQIVVDNYRQLSKPPLRVTIAEEPLPNIEGWYSGETHLHSSLTDDQVEFGASLDQTRKGALLCGLDFVTTTDHSYDLDDMPDNYLENDPELLKWKSSRKQIAAMNTETSLTMIPAEEISVANKRGDTVHLLHYNDPEYFPGSGDSGENWPSLNSELTIDDVLSHRSNNTVSVAAHTGYKFTRLQQLLLKRGFWESQDHDNSELDGVQILNGTPGSSGFQASRQLWIDALLRGKHLAVFGGSDAHGNFNRNWHVKLPPLLLGMSEDQILGQVRTLIQSKSNGVPDLIEGMKARRTALTTGPVGDLMLTHDTETVGIGETLSLLHDSEIMITLIGQSTDEFGAELDVALYWGDLVQGEESILHHEVDLQKRFNIQVPFTPATDGYLRMEISSEGSRWPGVYVSSPIWIEITP